MKYNTIKYSRSVKESSDADERTFLGLPLFRVKFEAELRSYPTQWQVSFRCPHCQCVHHHGWDTTGDPSTPTHRVKHCHKPGSPFEHGYYLVLTMPTPDALHAMESTEKARTEKPAIVIAKPAPTKVLRPRSTVAANGQMKISEVPAYVLAKYGLKVTRQTAYNWISKGIHLETLKVAVVRTPAAIPLKVTTPADVDDFLTRSSGGTIAAIAKT